MSIRAALAGCAFPATDPPQLRVTLQRLQQLSCQAESIDRFGHEGTRNRLPIFSPKFPLSMSEKWLIIQGIGPTVTVAYWVH